MQKVTFVMKKLSQFALLHIIIKIQNHDPNRTNPTSQSNNEALRGHHNNCGMLFNIHFNCFILTTMENKITYMGKEIAEVIDFKNKGTFEAYYAAERWIREKGYSRGSTCVFSPVAIMRGPYNLPQKWRNMTTKQRKSVDGVIEGEMREGPVRIVMFK